MTLEEKAGQLGVFSRPGGSDYNPGSGADWNKTVKLLRNGSIGSLYNGGGVTPNLALQRIAVEESRLGIPLIFGADVWHGMRTIFPIPLGEAASWNPEIAKQTARATAVEATSSGIQWTYSPMVDVARDQRWGRVAEGAGEDPFLGQAFARARVQGFQGPSLTANDSMVACLKHYAGYGGVAAGLDYSASDVSEATFRDVFLPPFIAGVEAGALTLMSAFIAIVGGVPATGSRWLQTEVLREELGFDGFVVSDYEADLELIDHGFAANESDAAQKALWAGVDMSMQSGLYRTYLPALVREGKVALATLDEAVRRVLNAKARMGLFDNPYRSLNATREAADHYIPAHDALALEVATQSVVLLKNEPPNKKADQLKADQLNTAQLEVDTPLASRDPLVSGDPLDPILPLRKSGMKIAVVGWWAEDQANAQGVGVIWGNESFVVTLGSGIAQAMTSPSVDLRVVNGSGVEAAIEGGVEAAVEAATWADVVVLAVGEPKGYSGEAQSRADITIPAAQMQVAEAVAATGTPIVALIKNGRALELSGAVADASAILVTWFLGKQTGSSIAALLFGDRSPSGRLPVSFPIVSGQQPYFYNHMSSGRPCVGKSRSFKNCWRDYPNAALYPFGHGLTYGVIKYDAPTFTPRTAKMRWDGFLNISTKVTNTGSRAADEVVQLYVHDQVASRVRPVRELKGFARIRLAAGASQEVTFTLDRHALSFAVANPHQSITGGNRTVTEPGMFTVWVTSSATAGTPSEFELLGQ
jgi:beta-glucosidase